MVYYRQSDEDMLKLVPAHIMYLFKNMNLLLTHSWQFPMIRITIAQCHAVFYYYCNNKSPAWTYFVIKWDLLHGLTVDQHELVQLNLLHIYSCTPEFSPGCIM